MKPHQMDLPLTGSHRRGDPQTSVEAALSTDVDTLYGIVLDALRFAPMTTEEIAAWSGRELASITPRMAPLERAGKVSRTSMKRAGRTGSKRIVWSIAP